ncbi:hypothetical protein DM01DRAFT_1182929 [Hesseltinella vesiculosa]|uniref:Uncharacterized protein n=1 Tax=Hesseltinella vesiculosa TaxID=101127 RepID=A0A1X2G482_9FUNG|nr:hypothetical protein DM01DRAFT_1182929 [Hesseltinella vesiculosa]
MNSDLNTNRLNKKYGTGSIRLSSCKMETKRKMKRAMRLNKANGRFFFYNNTMAAPRSVKSARYLTTGQKISAPKPVNLPSLRLENAVHTTSGAASSDASQLGTSPTNIKNTTSPSTSNVSRWQSFAKTVSSPSTDSASPVGSPSDAKEVAPSPTFWHTRNTGPSVSTATTSFPTVAESTVVEYPLPSSSTGTKKLVVTQHTKSTELPIPPLPFTEESKPSSMSWDEMVSEEMDFSVSVVEFADGTKVVVDQSVGKENGEDDTLEQDEYPTAEHIMTTRPRQGSISSIDSHGHYKRHTPTTAYPSRHTPTKWSSHDYDRYPLPHATSSPRSPTMQRDRSHSFLRQSSYRERRPSNTDSQSTWSTDSHSSLHCPSQRYYVKPHPPSHTLGSMSSSAKAMGKPESHPYPSTDDRPIEVAAAQRETMMTAAELAKKRRDADEAERQASAERARQKALALAAVNPVLKKDPEAAGPPHGLPEPPSCRPLSTSSIKAEPTRVILKRHDALTRENITTLETPLPVHSLSTSNKDDNTENGSLKIAAERHVSPVSHTPLHISKESAEAPSLGFSAHKVTRFTKTHSKLHKSPLPIVFTGTIAQSPLSKPSRLQFMMNPNESDDEVMVRSVRGS